MKLRYTFAVCLVAGLTWSSGASAHDPALHADPVPAAAPQAKPKTCEQLADRSKYKVDLNDSQTKALKERCDAEAASDAKKK